MRKLRPMPSLSDIEGWDAEALLLFLKFPVRFKTYIGKVYDSDNDLLQLSGLSGQKGLYELGLIEECDSFDFMLRNADHGQALIAACHRVADGMDIEPIKLSNKGHMPEMKPLSAEDT